MTGIELIECIQNNHLEDYTIVVCYETGEGSYPVRDIEIDDTLKTIELL